MEIVVRPPRASAKVDLFNGRSVSFDNMSRRLLSVCTVPSRLTVSCLSHTCNLTYQMTC